MREAEGQTAEFAAYHVELQVRLVSYDPHLLQVARLDHVGQLQLQDVGMSALGVLIKPN